MEKHHHYQQQLEVSHQKLKHVEGMGDQEHLSRNKAKHAQLEEKTKELGYKVSGGCQTGTLEAWGRGQQLFPGSSKAGPEGKSPSCAAGEWVADAWGPQPLNVELLLSSCDACRGRKNPVCPESSSATGGPSKGKCPPGAHSCWGWTLLARWLLWGRGAAHPRICDWASRNALCFPESSPERAGFVCGGLTALLFPD